MPVLTRVNYGLKGERPIKCKRKSALRIIRIQTGAKNKIKEFGYMKKVFKLVNLDCADCAAKMERNIRKIKGVKEASVSFMSQRITLEASDGEFDNIVREVERVMKKTEPECKLVY